ncbi:MAG: MFS transporter, partial [Candidatus Edwardsbacteria bacterium]|nr:MFS transporter [Candidatus Edwardsbacteria bacterium]
MNTTENKTQEPGKLSPNVVRLGWVSLFTDISSEMLYPVVPIFLTTALGAPMAALGLIEGLAESAANLLKIFSGWWSDRAGKRRPFVIGGYALSAFSKPLLALAQFLGWPFVLAMRICDRTGKGLRSSARDALIADYTPESQRGRAFGLHRAMDSFGAVLGPLAALFFMSRIG